MEVILDCSMKSLSGGYLLSFRAHLRPKILALEEELANSFSTPHVRGTKNKLQILMILKNTTIVVLKNSFVTLHRTAHCLQNRKYWTLIIVKCSYAFCFKVRRDIVVNGVNLTHIFVSGFIFQSPFQRSLFFQKTIIVQKSWQASVLFMLVLTA